MQLFARRRRIQSRYAAPSGLLLAIALLGSWALTEEFAAATPPKLRLIIETDAGGDPDDEQSLVRFLLYTNQWDVEGIIANRRHAIDGENENPERTGLGIVRRQLTAYGQCWPNLTKHDPEYPKLDQLWQRTVAGDDDTSAAVDFIIAAVDRDDPRPVWYADWGTETAAVNNLRRSLDRVLKERGAAGYAKFKGRLRLASAEAFGEHTSKTEPPFTLWVDTFRPELDGKRWYHRFSTLTATAGGFDIDSDVRSGHGPLGAMYPLNTTHRQKEGDTMTFLYLVPTGMNDPEQPTWGSWAGRYGRRDDLGAGERGPTTYWANQRDNWSGTTHRDNTLARWAVALQHDFAARLDWCVADDFKKANHNPIAVLNCDHSKHILELTAKAGETVRLSAAGSSDPDGQPFQCLWFTYPEAGTLSGELPLSSPDGETTSFVAPRVQQPETVHIILQLEDRGTPSLFAYRRAVITIEP